MSEGKSFHRHAPVTGKVRRPTVESLTAGTNRLLGPKHCCDHLFDQGPQNSADGTSRKSHVSLWVGIIIDHLEQL